MANTNEIDYKKYAKINLDDLVTYSLFSLISKKQDPSFENLVVETYSLFPKKFCLVGYPQYPDSSRIDKSWLRCRTDKNLIEGSVSSGFKLTSKGLKTVENLRKFFSGDVYVKAQFQSLKGEERTKAGRFVKNIANSKAWAKYKEKGLDAPITDFEFCDLISTTLETDPKIRRENFNALKRYVELYNRKDMMKLLEFCAVRFQNLLISSLGPTEYTGGMVKKRVRRG